MIDCDPYDVPIKECFVHIHHVGSFWSTLELEIFEVVGETKEYRQVSHVRCH